MPGTSTAQAEAYIQQVLELNPNNDHARAVLGFRHEVHGRSSCGLKLLPRPGPGPGESRTPRTF